MQFLCHLAECRQLSGGDIEVFEEMLMNFEIPDMSGQPEIPIDHQTSDQVIRSLSSGEFELPTGIRTPNQM